MTIAELIDTVRSRNVELWFEGDRLRYRAPKGALSAEFRSELAARRSEVIGHLRAVAAATQTIHPLSFTQRSLWFLHQQAPDSAAYHVALSVRVEGAIDIAALSQALQALMDRHAILRTIYDVVDGAPTQIIAASGELALACHDVAGMAEDELRLTVEADHRRPFDLASKPPVRASLYSRSPGFHVLLLTIHHIAVDGWSLLIIIDEMTKLYSEAITGEPARLPYPQTQYIDYTRWQEQTLNGPEGERLWSYWSAQLQSPPKRLTLPAARSRLAAGRGQGAAVPVALNADLTQRIKNLALQEGTTSFVVLLATFHVFLSKVGNSNDVIVGSPAIGRVKADFLQTVGDFVNSLPLRARMSPTMTFGEVVAQVRRAVLDALDAQEFPLSLMVQRLQPDREPGRSPLFDTFFLFQRYDELNEGQALLSGHASDDTIDFRGLQLGAFPILQQEGQFDLTLEMAERPSGISGVLKYRAELFDQATVQQLATDYAILADMLVRDPASAIETFNPPVRETPSDDTALFIGSLKQRDIGVSLDGDHLRVNAPKGLLDQATRAAIAKRRDEIIAHLRSGGGQDSDGIRRFTGPGPLPLSAAQQRLWFLDQMDPGRAIYNLGLALRLQGTLDLDLLRRAINALVSRHEALRMRIGESNGSPALSIEPSSEAAIEIADVAGELHGSRDDALLHHAERWLQQPFDLAHGPLARFLVVRLGADDHALIISVHHAVFDGWSITIAVRDICSFYSAFLAGQEPALAPLPLRYVDYAAWEREELQSGRLARQLAYWVRQLRAAPALLELPTDRPRQASQSFRGARLMRLVDDRVIAGLKAYGRRHDATPFMTLLAAWFVLLHRYSGQDDIVVGSPVANRNLPALENVVGCLVNTLALRARLDDNPTFADLLAQIKQTALAAFENADVAFDTVVEQLNPGRNASHAPIVQVLFTLLSFPTKVEPPTGLSVEAIPLDTRASRFDLTAELATFETGPHQGRFGVMYEYATDLFDAGTIERMHDHFVCIMSAIASGSELRIDDLSLITTRELELLETWNSTTVAHDRSRCAHHLVEMTAAAMPDKPAIRAGETTLSYGALDRRANQLAHLLRARGVRPGDLVAVCLERTVDIPVALNAILKIGAGYVPIDPAHPSERLCYVLADARVACAVTLERFTPLLESSGTPLVSLDQIDDELAAQPDRSPEIAVRPDDVAYVIYTSGSTGKPKGVQVEHRNLVSFLAAMRQQPGLTATDVVLAVTTLSFDIAGLELWLPLTVGAQVVIASRNDTIDGERLIHLLDEQHVTLLQATPATWRLLLAAGWTGNRSLKALCGGEALPRDLVSVLSGRVGELWNMYGPTETTIWSVLTRIVDPEAPITIGRPIANTRVHILDRSGQSVPIGVVGELCIAGEGVARGYWARPELTSEKFTTISLPTGRSERIYRTGDLARYRGNGDIEFLGRRDGQVKVRGHRIELGEIEAALATQPGIRECAVVARDDGPNDRRLVAYTTVISGMPFEPEQLRTFLRAKLPEYMVPSSLVALPALPLTGSGKIDRTALQILELPGPALPPPVDTAMSPEERRVAAVWRSVLRVEQIGLNDNFFDLGGHSLLLAKLHVDLKKEFSADLSLVELFQYTTVAGQAARLATAPSASHGAVQRARARAERQALAS